jgi:hypothetical protein
MMTQKTKTILMALALLAGVAVLDSCNKSNNPSIVGNWSLTSERERSITSGVTVQDTTVQFGTANPTILLLKSNSSFEVVSTGSTSSGVYVYSGSVLTLVDTNGGTPSSIMYQVSALSSNQLTIQRTDTTSATPPIQVNIYNLNLNK